MASIPKFQVISFAEPVFTRVGSVLKVLPFSGIVIDVRTLSAASTALLLIERRHRQKDPIAVENEAENSLKCPKTDMLLVMSYCSHSCTRYNYQDC